MKPFSWFILLVLIVLVLTSCKSMRPTSQSSTTDSTIVSYKPREVVLKLEPSEVRFIKHIECDPVRKTVVPFEATKTKSRATLHVSVTPSGDLTVAANCDSLEQVVSVLDKEVFRLRNQNKTTIIPEYRTRKIDHFCRWFTGISLLLFVAAIILWVKKKLPFF